MFEFIENISGKYLPKIKLNFTEYSIFSKFTSGYLLETNGIFNGSSWFNETTTMELIIYKMYFISVINSFIYMCMTTPTKHEKMRKKIL